MKRKPHADGTLAIDLGGSQMSICRLAESDTTEAGYELAFYGQWDLASVPPDHREESMKAVVDYSLKNKEYGGLAVSIPSRHVFIRVRSLPPIPEDQVLPIVRYEIQQQTPFDLKDINIGYQILEHKRDGGYMVLMMAVKKEAVEQHLAILGDARSRVKIVMPSALAAFNWLSHNAQIGLTPTGVLKPMAEALINIGAKTTEIVCFVDGQFIFARPINFGGDCFTAAIVDSFGCSWEEAEELKCEYGHAHDNILNPVLRVLVNELNRSFAYLRGLPGNAVVKYAHLTGGTSCLPGLKDYLTGALDNVLEVFLPDPLAGLGLNDFSGAPLNSQQTPVVLGLALACRQDVDVDINLMTD
ncbi:MAG: pilus assembly protein PilM [Patescibacteria group bacterium]